jgi:glycine betaine/choline ABC-type transport system substrate-binding protein
LKKIIAVIGTMALIASLFVGCSTEDKKVVIASKPMTEQYILVEMLTDLIEQETDIAVEQKMGIGGGTSNIHPGMENGEIDMYPEYTGTGWLFVLKEDLITDPNELYLAVKEGYQQEYDIKWMGLYGFNNTFALAVKRQLAEEYGIESYSDLQKISGNLDFGAEYDFYEREDGYPGLVETYGFDFANQVELDIGLKYEAIGKDEVDVINVFSTDGRLKEYDLVVLRDDKNFFPSYYATTIIRQDALDQYPELEGVLEMLTGAINDEEMTYLNYLVEIEKQDPAQVAEDFLKEKGLIK